MINHDIQSMNLDQYDEGEISLPSETQQSSFASNLRQFIILTRRAFNESALQEMADTEGLKVSSHLNVVAEPYFGLTLKVTPHRGDIKDFVAEQGEIFFDSLMRVVSTSTHRGISGKRAAFVRALTRDHSSTNTIETKIVVSTSIFFNDYRVTTGFPCDSQELDSVAVDIMHRLSNDWGHLLAFDVDTHLSPYDESVF